MWAPAVLVAAWAGVRLLGLERGWPLIPLMAFTPYAAVGAVLAAVLALGLRRRAPAVLAALSAAALVAVVVPRTLGISNGGSERVAVLTANVAAGAVPPEALVRLVVKRRPDVLSLQELTPEYARRLETAGLRRALPHAVLEARPRYAGTGLYARAPLRRQSPIRAGFTMARATTGAFELVAVHPPAPLRSSSLAGWRRGLRALPSYGLEGPRRILAGDFNATLDHAELRRVLRRGYRDAAAQTGDGLRPTWPERGWWLPPVTIDHVLSPSSCSADDTATSELPGSDHRAVFAVLVCDGAES